MKQGSASKRKSGLGGVVHYGNTRQVRPPMRTTEEEQLGRAVALVRQSIDRDEHQGKVHILMENGQRCDKWVDIDHEARRSGFSKRQLPQGQYIFRHDQPAE